MSGEVVECVVARENESAPEVERARQRSEDGGVAQNQAAGKPRTCASICVDWTGW